MSAFKNKNKVTLIEVPENIHAPIYPPLELLQIHIDTMNKEDWELTSVRLMDRHTIWICLWEKLE